MSVEALQKALSAGIRSKKLSGSVVDQVTEEARKVFHKGDSTVDIFVKAHQAAPTLSKLSSLYLLDAVIRDARSIVRKKGTGHDTEHAQAPQGSSADAGTADALMQAAQAFLDAASHPAEEILVDCLRSLKSEQKDKVFRILDFWKKAEAFTHERIKAMQATLDATRAGPSSPKVLAKESTARQTPSSSPARPASAQATPDPRLTRAALASPPKAAPVDLISISAGSISAPAPPATQGANGRQTVNQAQLPSGLLSTLSNLIGQAATKNSSPTAAVAPLPPASTQPISTFDPAQLALLQQALSQQGGKPATPPQAASLPASLPMRPPLPPPPPPPPLPPQLRQTRAQAEDRRRRRRDSRSRSPPPRRADTGGGYTSGGRSHSDRISDRSEDRSLVAFDPSSFDPTDVGSLESLAKAVEARLGFAPAPMHIMYIVHCLTSGSMSFDEIMNQMSAISPQQQGSHQSRAEFAPEALAGASFSPAPATFVEQRPVSTGEYGDANAGLRESWGGGGWAQGQYYGETQQGRTWDQSERRDEQWGQGRQRRDDRDRDDGANYEVPLYR